MDTKKTDKPIWNDLKKVKEVVVYATVSNIFLKITKKEFMKKAKNEEIDYYITDELFKVKRDVMVII